MKKGLTILAGILLFIILGAVSIFGGLGATWLENKIDFTQRKIDDSTNYKTIKQVEDTCRSMIASYESDRLTYEQYKDSEEEEKRSWGEQAKMRANKTASTYNNYIIKNDFVWKNNVPSDIYGRLEILQ